jgi:putative membrane protein
VGLLETGLDRQAVRARLATCPYLLDDFVSFTLLWGAVNLRFGNWLPVAVTVGLVLVLVRVERFDVASPRVPWVARRVRGE